MENYMSIVYLIGGIIVFAAIFIIVGIQVTKSKARKKSVRSLPKGSDDSDFTQEFIRRYNDEN